MTTQEKVKHIRDITMSPFNKINAALTATFGDIDKAIEILLEQKQTSAEDMENRISNAGIVYSYVHNNKVGAMIVLACQTDFVAKNDEFINLAKDICMHICSNPIAPEYIDGNKVPVAEQDAWKLAWKSEIKNKPEPIIEKIVTGKLNKALDDLCLLRQKFIKNDNLTIKELIQTVSGTVGEKIELKRFVKMKNDL